MPAPRTFISFDFDNDEDHRVLFVGQSVNSRTPFNIQDWSSKNKLKESEWEGLIEDKIGRCHLMIVLIGPKTWFASGVLKEIKMAIACNVPFFGVYVNGADTNTFLPAGLSRNRVIDWGWDNIASAIDQMMTEGKNKSKEK